MIELRLLGPPRVLLPNGLEHERLARQPKRMALLAYLGVGGTSGAHRRDKLVALFWPEADETRARSALSQAIYVLRSELGEHVFASQGEEEIGLDRAYIRSDVAEFEASVDEGRPDAALALYRGDLLDGFFVSGVPDFERWVEEQRSRLRLRASDAAWAMAERLAHSGRTVDAVRWARRAAGFAPADEAVIRRLITFLNSLGDRAAAVRAYESFAWNLAREYELEPSQETQALVDTIRANANANTHDAATPEHVALAPPTPGPNVSGTASRSARRPLPFVGSLALMILFGLAAATASVRGFRARPAPVTRFALDFTGVPALAAGVTGSTIALAPDGSALVYVGAGKPDRQLYLRPMDRLAAVPVPHTSGAGSPFFSPDGKWLGFVVGTTLQAMKVGGEGGPAITIARAEGQITGATWGRDDRIVFATPAGLWHVSAGKGTPVLFARADTARGQRFRWPAFLAHGRAVLLTIADSTGFRLAAASLETGAVTTLGLEGTHPTIVADRFLVYARSDGAVLAAPLDDRQARVTGPSVAVGEGAFVGLDGAAKLGVSSTGVVAFVENSASHVITLVDQNGRAEPLPLPPHWYGPFRLSPDGQRLAVSVRPRGGLPDLWLLDLRSRELRRLTFDGGTQGAAVWSRSGRTLAYRTKPGTRLYGYEIRRYSLDGEGPGETLVPADVALHPVAFTPDERSLVFERRDPDRGSDIFIMPLTGQRRRQAYLAGPADEHAPALAPNGRWMAYESAESGRDEVYIAAFPRPGVPRLVSTFGGWTPRWAPSGRALFFRTDSGMVMVAFDSVSMRPTPPRILFDDRDFVRWPRGTAFDVRPEGGFVMLRRPSKAPPVLITLHFFENLARE